MAGRQTKLSKGTSDLYDTGRGHVFAEKIQPLPDNMKKKISIILEAVPSKSKTEIAEVLQACDYDIHKALNCFISDGGMEVQNEWLVQGKRKNKKRKKFAKKPVNNAPASFSQVDPESAGLPDNKTEKNAEAGEKKVNEEIPNGTILEEKPASKPVAIINNNTISATQNFKPVLNDVPKPNETTLIATSPPLLSPVGSPTESLNLSQDLQTSFKKGQVGVSANEKHSRVHTMSGSGSEVIKKSLKDLQRSSVSIARYQSMLDEAESSTKMLAKSFQAIRQALDERERFVQDKLQSLIEEAKRLLEERQVSAAGLKFKCNRVGSMSEEETTELRNEIKHFVGERRIDEDLSKAARFLRDQEKMLEAVKNFGEVLPIKHHYTPYKRKHSEPSPKHSEPSPKHSEPSPSRTITDKSHPVKASTGSSNVSTSASVSTSSSVTRSGDSRNHSRPVLSPSRLKDQAEIHARLKQAVKEQQQVQPVSKEHSEQPGSNARENPKPKDSGANPNRNTSKGQKPGNQRREQVTPRPRYASSSSQNSTKFSHGTHGENQLTNSENSKIPVQSNGAKTLNGDDISQLQTGSSSMNSGTQEQNGSLELTTTHKPEGTSDMLPYQGNRRSKRRYVRRTQPGDGSPISRTATPDDSIKENGDHNETGSSDLPNGQLENHTTNGVNGFVPLPQRNRRTRIYYKKDPDSKIEFPPTKENVPSSS